MYTDRNSSLREYRIKNDYLNYCFTTIHVKRLTF